jgi:cyclic pyranopterin phosphate synthase
MGRPVATTLSTTRRESLSWQGNLRAIHQPDLMTDTQTAPVGRLTHQDEAGRPRMVDVGPKAETRRTAVAEGSLRMAAETLRALNENRVPKGDPLVVAQIAGIQAAKRTSELIPLCHPLPLTAVDVQVETDESLPGIRARASAEVHGRTGVEMEALTAVAIALLTAYDMLKALDRSMVIDQVRLLRKEGGRSGTWHADDPTQRVTENG